MSRGMELCGVMWRYEAFFGVIWCHLASCGDMLRNVALFVVMWRCVAL